MECSDVTQCAVHSWMIKLYPQRDCINRTLLTSSEYSRLEVFVHCRGECPCVSHGRPTLCSQTAGC